MGYNRADDYFYMSAVEKQASRRVYKRTGVTSKELNILAGLAACLQLRGRKVISRDIFFDWIGGNRRFNDNSWYYLRCLISKGALHRMSWRNLKPGAEGNCLAISGFGIKVLELFDQAINEIEQQDAQQRATVSSYKDLLIKAGSPPAGYTINQAGRDD